MRASSTRKEMRRKKRRKKVRRVIVLSICGLALITIASYLGFKAYMINNKQVTTENNNNITALSKANEQNKDNIKPDTKKTDNNVSDKNNIKDSDEKNKNDENKVNEQEKPIQNPNTKVEINENNNEFDSDIIQNYIDGNGCSNNKKVAFLTFDDGPSVTNTPKILNTLDQYGIKGTFFVLGAEIDRNEESKNLLRQIYEKGHGIGNHGYSHRYDIMYPNGYANADNCIREFNSTVNSMRAVLGKNFNCNMVRFPGGHMSWKGMASIQPKLDSNGYKYIDWNCVNGDSEGVKRNPSQLLQRVKECYSGQNKLVVLMHDTYGKENTAEILPKIIEFLQNEGYEFGILK